MKEDSTSSIRAEYEHLKAILAAVDSEHLEEVVPAEAFKATLNGLASMQPEEALFRLEDITVNDDYLLTFLSHPNSSMLGELVKLPGETGTRAAKLVMDLVDRESSEDEVSLRLIQHFKDSNLIEILVRVFVGTPLIDEEHRDKLYSIFAVFECLKELEPEFPLGGQGLLENIALRAVTPGATNRLYAAEMLSILLEGPQDALPAELLERILTAIDTEYRDDDSESQEICENLLNSVELMSIQRRSAGTLVDVDAVAVLLGLVRAKNWASQKSINILRALCDSGPQPAEQAVRGGGLGLIISFCIYDVFEKGKKAQSIKEAGLDILASICLWIEAEAERKRLEDALGQPIFVDLLFRTHKHLQALPLSFESAVLRKNLSILILFSCRKDEFEAMGIWGLSLKTLQEMIEAADEALRRPRLEALMKKVKELPIERSQKEF